MDFPMRNVDAGALKRIDEFAKKKGVSRNAYLKQLIETHAIAGEIDETKDRYEQLVETIVSLWRDNLQLSQEIKSILDKEGETSYG